jgi:hypothetical protein
LLQELENLRDRMQVMEATASSSAATAVAQEAAPPAAGETKRYDFSTVQKIDAISKKAHAMELMLSGVTNAPYQCNNPERQTFGGIFKWCNIRTLSVQ